MHVLITGANGYLGRRLARRLGSTGRIGEAAVRELTLTDLSFDPEADAAGGRQLIGDLTRRSHVDALADLRPDVVFHLACIASGATEQDVHKAARLNLGASLALFETLARSTRNPRVVFSSSIAVLGRMRCAVVTDETSPRPSYSYGAQKLAGEIILSDLTRRGELRGRSVRLPGIVVRPALPNGARSAFSSDLIRAMASGRHYVCPVSASATTWLMSLERCLDNLLHAASIDRTCDEETTAWTMPALHVSIQQLIDALARRLGPRVHDLVSFVPDPDIELDFGRMPPLESRTAELAGFRGDGSIDELLRRALPEITIADADPNSIVLRGSRPSLKSAAAWR